MATTLSNALKLVPTAASTVKATVTPTYTVQDFVKENPGYTATWDKNTNTSTLANALGQTVNFTSGQKNDALGISGQVSNNSNVVDPNKLKAAFAQTLQPQPQQTQQIAPNATDNSGLINSQYDSLISALKSQIQQSINNKNTEISGLGAKYQPQKNTSEVAKNNDLRTALEISANNGDRGGIGRQQALDTQTAGDNRLNQIGLQQTSDETTLRNDISNLLLEGNVQEATQQASRLKDLIANNQYVDSTNYSRSRDTVADTGKLANGQYTQSGLMNSLNIDSQTLQNEALPQQIKDQATILQQNIQKGTIDIATGQAQLKELTNPKSVTNQLAKLGLDTAKFNYSQLSVEAKQKADQVANDLANGRMNRQQAQSSIDHAGDSLTASNARLKWEQDPNNPANQKVNTNTTFTVDDWGKTLDGEFLPKYDSSGNVVVAATTPNTADREKRILALGLSSDMTKALYQRYNIPLPK